VGSGQLDERDRSRLARSGVSALSAEEGLELFDAATKMDEAQVIPMRLDSAALREQVRAGTVPALLRGLIRVPIRGSASSASKSLGQRLEGVSDSERERMVLELVRAEAAAALGHPSAQAIGEQQAFKDLGFDSLAAVEMRNRLTAATGLNIPASLVFDYPTPVAVADYLLSEVTASGAVTVAVDSGLDRLELALPSIAADNIQRLRITARLQGLLSKLADETATSTVDEDLESVTDDEMFSLIDSELGGL
jgi:acyl carrier protein